MLIQLAAVADAANVAEGKKLNIMGIFDTIRAVAFPVVHPSMALAFRLRLEFEDSGKSAAVVIRLEDEDGKMLLKAETTLSIPQIPAGESRHLNQVINFNGLQFPRPGRYAFVFDLPNQREAMRLPLILNQVK